MPDLEDAAGKPAVAEPDSGGRRALFLGLGVASAGLGAAAIGAGAAFGVRAQGNLAASNEGGCNVNRCTPEGASLRDEARAAGNVSTAMFIAGGVLAAGGIGFLLAAPAAHRAAPAAAGAATAKGPKIEARAGVSPAGGALSIQGRW